MKEMGVCEYASDKLRVHGISVWLSEKKKKLSSSFPRSLPLGLPVEPLV